MDEGAEGAEARISGDGGVNGQSGGDLGDKRDIRAILRRFLRLYGDVNGPRVEETPQDSDDDGDDTNGNDYGDDGDDSNGNDYGNGNGNGDMFRGNPPSALEFMRAVALNRPLVARGAAAGWEPVRAWDAAYLAERLGDTPVRVAMTPLGNADAVLEKPDGSLSFVKPHEELRPFAEVLRYIQDQEREASPSGNIYYCQSQNDNLSGEYEVLRQCGVPRSVDFARIALGREPEAVNLWLGNRHSTTALHKDNYENVYVQVRGRKHFVLLPPVALPGVNERRLPQETYVPEGVATETADEVARGSFRLVPQRDQPDGDGHTDDGCIPVAVWDPDDPGRRPTECSDLLEPIRITLDEGDMLYLPAMWYHKVSQSCGSEGFCCALNYWYDMDMRGALWSMVEMLRELTHAQERV